MKLAVLRQHCKQFIALVAICCMFIYGVKVYFDGREQEINHLLLPGEHSSSSSSSKSPPPSHKAVALLRKKAQQCLDGRSKNETARHFYFQGSSRLDRNVLADFKQWLRWQYFGAIRDSLISPDCRPRFIVYQCSTRNKKFGGGCGGWGDRIRGMVSVFYLAVMSGRIFYANVNHPESLENFFEINHKLYRSPNFEPIASSLDTTYFNFLDSFRPMFDLLGDGNFSDRYTGRTVVISSNFNHNALFENSSLFDNPNFAANFERVFVQFPQFPKLTRKVVLSAAIGLLFGRPQVKLQRAFEDFVSSTPIIGGLDGWLSAYRIGIQIRVELAEWLENGTRRVQADQLHCFVAEAIRIARGKLAEQLSSVIVYVTSSDLEITKSVIGELASSGIKAVSIKSPPIHLDRLYVLKKSNLTSKGVDALSVRTYLDWYLLTQMDELIASESGFSISAALAGAIPSRTFDHKHSTNNSCLFREFITV